MDEENAWRENTREPAKTAERWIMERSKFVWLVENNRELGVGFRKALGESGNRRKRGNELVGAAAN